MGNKWLDDMKNVMVEAQKKDQSITENNTDVERIQPEKHIIEPKTFTPEPVHTIEKKKGQTGRKAYKFANNRPVTKLTVPIYDAETVRRMSLERGFGGCIAQYIAYLIDVDSQYVDPNKDKP